MRFLSPCLFQSLLEQTLSVHGYAFKNVYAVMFLFHLPARQAKQ
jgi:hypothetical protein